MRSTVKVYDCFSFYNEFDVLEIRLRELYDVVDRFVLVEAGRTHAGAAKPLFFRDQAERFRPFADKIHHVVVDDMPEGPDDWRRENFQRNAAVRGLADLAADDLVLIADSDEIPRRTAVAAMRADAATDTFVGIMPMFCLKLNYVCVRGEAQAPWLVAVRGRRLITPQHARDARFRLTRTDLPATAEYGPARVLTHAGWHFSSLGDAGHVANKIRNFAHQEFNRPEFLDTIDIDALIAARRDLFGRAGFAWAVVTLDDYFPAHVRAERERFRRHIIDITPTDGNIPLPR